MCGICGFWGDPASLDRQAMMNALRHRGPDDCGTFEATTQAGTLWLGHQRLSIQDVSPAGHQPMSLPSGDLTITFNGEIYNFHELKKQLEKQGCYFRSACDTEVILHAWQTWGLATLDRLRGMFAFAIWSKRDQKLWLVRDRLGEKPLYYYNDARRILFSFEVRALLASGVTPRELDSEGLDSYLTFGSVVEPYTLARGIRSVNAGHYLLITPKLSPQTRAYWDIRNIEEASPHSRRKLVSDVGEVLRESAQLTTVSDVPVAVLLSGGIDSSANVVMLSEHGGNDLRTFSVIFEGPDTGHSEERWSNLVAEKFCTEHSRVIVSQDEAMRWVPEAVSSMDQPSWDGVNTYLVCKAISSAGLKVAISGQGSDELFLGYSQREMFQWLVRIGRLPLRSLSPLVRQVARRLPIRDTKYEKILQTIGSPDALASAYLAQHSIFSQAGLHRLRGSERPSQTRFVHDCGGKTALGKLSRLELVHYLRSTLLRDADQMSMAHSLELRAPFVDYRLIELVSSVPASMRVDPPDRQKPLLVDAVGPGLPSEIANRPKQGFGLPYGRWLRSGLAVADPVTANIGLDPKAINDVRADFLHGKHWSRYWALQVLAAWATHQHMASPAPLG